MIIENNIEDGIDFFHMDALSSSVAMKVNFDLGNGYQNAKSRHIFRDYVDATGHVMITENEILVRFQKRAHNPLLIAAGFDKIDTPIPWLGGKRLRLIFG
jgi:hypothetical protein